MKRGGNLARSPIRRGTATLKRKTPLRAKAPLSRSTSLSPAKRGPSLPAKPSAGQGRSERARLAAKAKRREPGYAEWKRPVRGRCQACGRYCPRLERHHVLDLQRCKRERASLYDLANSMLLCPEPCHRNHTDAFKRLPMARVPDAAIAFAVSVLGLARAGQFFARTYRDAGDDPRLVLTAASQSE